MINCLDIDYCIFIIVIITIIIVKDTKITYSFWNHKMLDPVRTDLKII